MNKDHPLIGVEPNAHYAENPGVSTQILPITSGRYVMMMYVGGAVLDVEFMPDMLDQTLNFETYNKHSELQNMAKYSGYNDLYSQQFAQYLSNRVVSFDNFSFHQVV